MELEIRKHIEEKTPAYFTFSFKTLIESEVYLSIFFQLFPMWTSILFTYHSQVSIYSSFMLGQIKFQLSLKKDYFFLYWERKEI